MPLHLKLILALLMLAAPLGAQRVEIRVGGKPAPDTVSMFAYDTLQSVEAVALDARGRKAASAKPSLVVHMAAVATLVSASRAKGNVYALAPGLAFAVASWPRTDGKTLTDTMRILVPRARVVSLELCSGFRTAHTDAGDLKECVPLPAQLPPGVSACVYVVGRDRKGGYVTGLDPHLTSSDPNVAVVSSAASCPDTTVSPYKLFP